MKLIVGNQKSYLNSDAVDIFIDNLNTIQKKDNILICPSSIYIERFIQGDIRTGCQNVSKNKNGGYTGELAVEQLKSIGVSFALVGHSEVRKNFHETIEDTNIKILKLIANDIVPILCVGETDEERENNETIDVILRQIQGALEGLSTYDIKKVIIAYEPVWAIGTGNVPSNEDIEEVVATISDFFFDNYQFKAIILYGGSVNPNNIDTLNEIKGIDGYLIGGASSKIDEFIEIINKCQKED